MVGAPLPALAADLGAEEDWSSGLKDLAPILMLIDYKIKGNAIFDLHNAPIVTFFFIAAIFMLLNNLQARVRPHPFRSTRPTAR